MKTTNRLTPAFTMVELIFVIVIIAILAATALPKLAATRDDAVESKICKNVAVCVTDLAAKYTATHSAALSDSPACQDGDVNPLVSLSGTGAAVVSGAPDRCAHLNRTFIFGGSRVSF